MIARSTRDELDRTMPNSTFKLSAINIFGGMLFCSLLIVYLFPFSDQTIIQTFSTRYSDALLLAFLIVTIGQKLLLNRQKLEPLFWLFIGCAFLSWFGLTLLRLFYWEHFSTGIRDFIANISYFLYYALMIAAIEIKSFSSASKFLSPRSLITSLSILTFLIGAFSYFVLLPSQPVVNVNNVNQQAFFFYMLMDSYLLIRWWHLAWQLKSYSFNAFIFLGLANLNWLVADFLEYSTLFETKANASLWLDWIWYSPYLLFFVGIQTFSKVAKAQTLEISFSRYHILNSPLFFLGVISLLFLLESDTRQLVDNSSFQAVQIIWLAVTLALALFQIVELFKTNKKRKFDLIKLKSKNLSVVSQLEQRTRELELQVSSNQMILNSVSNPILTLTLEGKIITCNLATTQLLQYSVIELVDKKLSDLIPEDDAFHHFFDYQSYRQQLSKSSKGLELESKILTAKNQSIDVHVSISQGVELSRDRLIVTLANVSQQKKAEQQLHDIKDEFTANISHEFRTPLTIVNGVIEDLLIKASDSNSIEQLNTAKRNNLRLIHMVDQLLELSRVAAESLPLIDFDATEWVALVCQSYNTIASDRNIDFGFRICKPLLVRGNQQAFENILYNLLSNAFKYTKQGGSVNVSLEPVDGNYQLIVADTGIGISKQEQIKIFDRFQRSEIDNQHSIPGVGIGLSLVKDLVAAMDWQIEVQSIPNKGSKFILTISKALTDTIEDKVHKADKKEIIDQQQVSFLEAEIAEQNTHKTFNKSKYLVLVIEDNLDMQRHLENILSPHHQCLIASNGKQGLSMAEEFLPDIIISDVMMPGIDGFEVLAQIRQQSFTTHIPVIMLTAKSDQKSKNKGLAAEADDYLSKPFDAEELLIKISNQLKVRKKLQQKYESQWQGFGQAIDEPLPDNLENDFLAELNSCFERIYLDANYSMNQLAGELAMSERQLQRKIKALIDITPLELLKRFRLEKAKLQLRQNMQVGLVAQSCGFSSQTYFGRCFKEHFGITPKAYQQQQ